MAFSRDVVSSSTFIHYATSHTFLPDKDRTLIMEKFRYLENSTELGKEVEAQFAEKAQVLSPEERLSAFNAHM